VHDKELVYFLIEIDRQKLFTSIRMRALVVWDLRSRDRWNTSHRAVDQHGRWMEDLRS
jgi:hypothetical protein